MINEIDDQLNVQQDKKRCYLTFTFITRDQFSTQLSGADYANKSANKMAGCE